MKCIYTLGKFIAFAIIPLFTVTGIFAQEPLVEPDIQASSGLSGKVVDTKGKPIAGFTFMIQSMQNLKGPPPPMGMLPFAFEELLKDQNNEGKPRAISKAKTDAEGAFSVTNIQPGTIQINAVPKAMLDVLEKGAPNLPPEIQQNLPPELQQNLPPELQRIPMGLMHPGRRESEMQILSIRLNKVTFFYTEGPGPFEGFAFGLKPGVTLKTSKLPSRNGLSSVRELFMLMAHLSLTLKQISPCGSEVESLEVAVAPTELTVLPMLMATLRNIGMNPDFIHFL